MHSAGRPARLRRALFRSASVAAIVLEVGAALAAGPALAGETIAYSYDALGRLTKVSRSGTINAGATACYAYDKANNRSNVTSATATDCAVAPVSFSISSNGAITEGTASVFTITKTGTATGSLSVNYATANGSAIAGSDYTAKSGTLTFTTAQTSLTVSVSTTDDSAVESAENFTMSLSAPTGGATIGTGTATATINDNDTGSSTCSGISFAVSDTSTTEGGALVFTVTKSGATTATCNVNYATANGTAGTADYTATSGTLSFTGAQNSKDVAVQTTDDTKTELDETVLLNLSAPTSPATISDSQGVGTIIDNETSFMAPEPPPEGS